MEMGISLRLRQKMDMQLAMAQKMTAQILRMPIGTLDLLLNKIVEHPEEYNDIDTRVKVDGNPDSKAPINLSGFLNLFDGEGEGTRASRGGVILNPSLERIFDRGDSRQIGEDKEDIFKLTEEDMVDGSYIPRDGSKPTFIPGKLLQPLRQGMSLLQIPSEFEQTSKLFDYLKKEREWIAKTLRDAYEKIGSKQREFVNTLDPQKLNLYPQYSLAGDLDLSNSTISRILRNRYVKIEGEREDVLLPTKHLFANSSQMIFYDCREKMNGVFAIEGEERQALSDRDIAKLINQRCRRTVTKYRRNAGIPDAKGRQGIYDLGRDVVFKIGTKYDDWVAN